MKNFFRFNKKQNLLVVFSVLGILSFFLYIQYQNMKTNKKIERNERLSLCLDIFNLEIEAYSNTDSWFSRNDIPCVIYYKHEDKLGNDSYSKGKIGGSKYSQGYINFTKEKKDKI